MNNPAQRLSLPLVLPHWVTAEPVPFVYLVDRYRELEDNALWFAARRSVVAEEIILDLTGGAVLTSGLGR